jgi:hypothetical protein
MKHEVFTSVKIKQTWTQIVILFIMAIGLATMWLFFNITIIMVTIPIIAIIVVALRLVEYKELIQLGLSIDGCTLEAHDSDSLPPIAMRFRSAEVIPADLYIRRVYEPLKRIMISFVFKGDKYHISPNTLHAAIDRIYDQDLNINHRDLVVIKLSILGERRLCAFTSGVVFSAKKRGSDRSLRQEKLIVTKITSSGVHVKYYDHLRVKDVIGLLGIRNLRELSSRSSMVSG